MSNSEAKDSSDNSETDSFYSPVNSSKISETHNAKKRTRLEIASTSSDSPSPVQNRIVKILKQGDRDSSTLSSNKMDDAMKTFFKELVMKSEERIKSEISDVKNELEAFKQQFIEKVEFVNVKMESLKLEVSEVSYQMRKKNVIIHGLPEKKNEGWVDLEAAVADLYKQLGLPCNPDFDDCFRLGKPAEGKMRPVLLKLIRFRDKKLIMSQTKSLKGTKIYINDDQSKDERKKLSILRLKERELRKDHPEARVYIRGQILIYKKGTTTKIYQVNADLKVTEQARGIQEHEEME
jgi:3'-phosphoadenosine 5'-phosphosulfate sulfotransferase